MTTRTLITLVLLLSLTQWTFAGSNQESAEKIADSIGKNYPEASIDVSYQGGKVWLKGTVPTAAERKAITNHIFKIDGLKVSEVNDEIEIKSVDSAARIGSGSLLAAPVPLPRRIAGTQSKSTPAIETQKDVAAADINTAPQAVQDNTTAKVAPKDTAENKYSLQNSLSKIWPFGKNKDKGQNKVQQTAAVTENTQSGEQKPAGNPPQAVGTAQPATYPYPSAAFSQNGLPPVNYPAAYGVPAYTGMVQGPVAYPPQAYYPPQTGDPYNPEAYGPQAPLPGQYNQPNLPDYAWPAYANYPNYAQVSYPKQYSPKAWPYIGPFYPYPQTPLGWRKVTLENHDGWWWLDFDDNSSPGPFSPLFRQPMRYTY